MAEKIGVPPFSLTFKGYDADRHTADALYIGQSLVGTAKTYNAIANMYFAGRIVPTGIHQIRAHVGPIKEGSIFYAIYLMMIHGQMPVLPEVAIQLAEFAIPKWLKAIIAKRSGQTKLLEKTVGQMTDQFSQMVEFATEVRKGDLALHHRLLETVDRLAEHAAGPLREMAAPVGRTVKSIKHFEETDEIVEIDPPVAEALRSRVEIIVGETQTMLGKIKAVDTVKGTGKLLVEGQEKSLKIQITDPVLTIPNNVYTHALDTQADVQVTAKPLTKEGLVAKLFVSDAKPVVR